MDDQLQDYDDRARGLLRRLPDADPSAKTLRRDLVKRLGTGSPRLISVVHEADAWVARDDAKKAVSAVDDAQGTWGPGGLTDQPETAREQPETGTAAAAEFETETAQTTETPETPETTETAETAEPEDQQA